MSLVFAPSSPESKRASPPAAAVPYFKEQPLMVSFTGSMFAYDKKLVPTPTKYALTRTVGDVLEALLKHNPAVLGKGSVGAMVHKGNTRSFVCFGTSHLPCSTTLTDALKIVQRTQWKNLEVLSERDTKRESDQLQVCVGMWKKKLSWPLWIQGVDKCALSNETLGEPGCGLRDIVLVAVPDQPLRAVSRTSYILAAAEAARAEESKEPVTGAVLTPDQVNDLVATCGTLDVHVLPMIRLPACTIGMAYAKLFAIAESS